MGFAPPLAVGGLFCETLIVSRFTLERLASGVADSDSGSVGPRHQDSNFLTGFIAAFSLFDGAVSRLEEPR